MTDEELIYQMTKAVYARLGPQADARLVEEMVTDLARLVARGMERGAAARADLQGARVIVSAFGTSRPGVVAAIASTLAEAQYNIVDMNQTVTQGKFAMMVIAEAGAEASDLGTLKEQLRQAGERVGVRVYVQREDLFQAMHRV